MFSVYILECGDGTLYVGVTTELAARLDWHKAGHGSAIASERQLKRSSAQKKRALIRGNTENLHRLAKRRKPKRRV